MRFLRAYIDLTSLRDLRLPVVLRYEGLTCVRLAPGAAVASRYSSSEGANSCLRQARQPHRGLLTRRALDIAHRPVDIRSAYNGAADRLYGPTMKPLLLLLQHTVRKYSSCMNTPRPG